MKKGDVAELNMQKMLLSDGEMTISTHNCIVLRYDDKQEYLYLNLKTGNLSDVSLDAVYQCVVKGEYEEISCTGRVTERYHEKEGNVLKMQVENGFYKINIKCVDKQMA